jgi:AraC family transcriptional regulator of adaptative response/methylated-DNA-[protein]-cysteine methyltransferase
MGVSSLLAIEQATGAERRQPGFEEEAMKTPFSSAHERWQAVVAGDRRAAGFGCAGRGYQSAARHLGMTPSPYRRGASGLEIRFAMMPCPLGWVLVAVTERGICAIEIGDEPTQLREQLARWFPKARTQEAATDVGEHIRRVVATIVTPSGGVAFPLDVKGTAFQHRVWTALQQIPLGKTASYSDIAQRIARPGAARAVARACAGNKLMVVIPCHRVIRSDGALGGYRGGVARKRALLQKERELVVAGEAHRSGEP